MKDRTLAEIDADASATATVPRLLDAAQIADLLRISTRTFRQRVHDGEFPKPILIGPNSPRWTASDYTAYVAKLRAAQIKRSARNG
jgi:predicted DNA-binding transcriptional regulator AlpA